MRINRATTLVVLFTLLAISSLVYLFNFDTRRIGFAANAADVNAQFLRTNKPRGWIGGDGGTSVRLPDGRVLFLWADSFIGTITNEGKYGPFYKLVRNSLTTVAPDGDNYTTYVNGAPGKETAYIPNVDERPENFLWPMSAKVDGDKVLIFANEWRPDASKDFGSAFTGNTWLVTLTLPTLAVESRTQIISNDQIQWGSTLFSDVQYCYVAGDLNGETYMYKVPAAQLNAQPRYFNGTDWSQERTNAKPVSTHNLQAITKIGGEYVALFMDAPFPKKVNEAHAKNISGPWKVASKPVFTIPEAANNKLLQYMPRMHTALSGSDNLVMSYSVNAYNIKDIPENPTYYIPHFFKSGFSN